MNKRNPKKYGIVINAAKCIDCKACTIACKVENNLPTHRIVNQRDFMGLNRKQAYCCNYLKLNIIGSNLARKYI